MARERRSTPSRTARLRFLEAGLTVLAREGYAALKLARVCEQAAVTTGSFYHAFDNWGNYTSALIEYWREQQSRRLIAEAREVADIEERLEFLLSHALALPHESEGAIRIWAAHDPEVYRLLSEVDRERRDFLAETWRAALGDPHEGEIVATMSMYLLIGYQNGTLHSYEAFERGMRMLADSVPKPATHPAGAASEG